MTRSAISLAACLLSIAWAVRFSENNFPEDEEDQSPAPAVPAPAPDTSTEELNFADIIFGRNMRLNVAEEQEAMAGFVLQDNEYLLLAFSTWRVKTYFTTDRILFKRSKLFQFPRAQWTSLSYDIIKAWSMRSSGSFLIQSTALKVWTSVQAPEASVLNITFRNTTKDDDKMLYDVNLVLTQKVIGETIDEQKFSQLGAPWTFSNLFWFWNVGFHGKKISQVELEQQLRAKVPLLGGTEQVRMAFQNGRDFEVYTNKRFIHVDTKWWTGRVVEYRSIPWREAAVWAFKTAEFIDLASDLTLFTAIPGLPHTQVRVKPTPEMEHEIHRICAEQVMQGRTDPNLPVAKRFTNPNGFFRLRPELSNGMNFDSLVKNEIPALLNVGETANLFIMDLLESTALTTQRWIGLRRGIASLLVQNVPWVAARAFTMRYDNGFRWNGQHGGLKIYTGVKGETKCRKKSSGSRDSSTRSNEDADKGEECKTIPGMGVLQHNFRWFKFRGFKPDMIFLHRMIAEKVLGKVDDSQPSVVIENPNPDGAMFSKNLQTWLEGSSGELPSSEAQEVLDAEHFLLPGERVTFALRLWRNTMVFTVKRLVMFQRFGIFGRIMEYTSIPYSSIVSYQTRSAGVVRIGGEVRLWTSTPAKLEHVFRLSLINGLYKSEGAAVMLARHVLLTPENGYKNATALLENTGAFIVHWMFGNFGNITEEKAEAKIRTDAPLLPDERIFAAFQSGRDMLVLTTLRLVMVDVKWFSGESVEYRSVPYSSCRMWSLDFGAFWHRLDIWTDVHNGSPLSKVTKRFQAAEVDAAMIDNFLRDKILLLNARPVNSTATAPSPSSNSGDSSEP